MLKWVAPKEVLKEGCTVCRVWTEASKGDELWITFFDIEEKPALKFCSSFKLGYFYSHCAKYSLFLPSKQSIDVFNARKKKWVRQVRLQQRLPTDGSSAYTVLLDGTLLICGGGDPILQSTYRVDLKGTVAKLKDMKKARAEHGIVLIKSAVYVFGGENDVGMMRSMEKIEWESLWEIHESVWVKLGKMHAARKLFKPCVYQELVYLFGGFTPSFEIYDPRLNEVRLHSFTLSDFDSETFTVVDKSEIHLFTNHSYQRFSADSFLHSVSYPKLATVWGKRNGVLYHHSVYFTFNNLVHKFDLRKVHLSKVT